MTATGGETAGLGSTIGFLRLEWRFLSFGLLVSFWSSPGQTFLISLFRGVLREELALTHGGFGSLYTVGTLASAALLLPAGRLIDRLPLAVFTRWVVLGLAAAAAGFTLVAGPLTLAIGIFALRFTGQGLMSHIALTAMARRYRRERGRAVAVASLGMPLGEGLFPVVIVWALTAFAWRSIWLALAAAVLVTLLPLLPYLLARTERQDGPGAAALHDPKGPERSWTRGELLRDPRFYLFIPLSISTSAIVTGILFHQVHLVALKGWSLAWWGSSFLCYAAASVVAGAAAGLLIDRFSARAFMPYVLLPSILSLALFAAAGSPWAAPAVLGLMGASAGAHSTALTALYAELYGTRHLGAIRALGTALMVFASALGPVAMGLPLDAGASLEVISLWSAAIMVLTSLTAGIGLRARLASSSGRP